MQKRLGEVPSRLSSVVLRQGVAATEWTEIDITGHAARLQHNGRGGTALMLAAHHGQLNIAKYMAGDRSADIRGFSLSPSAISRTVRAVLLVLTSGYGSQNSVYLVLAREPVPVCLEAGASQDSLNAASTSCPRCSRPVGCHGYAPWSSWWCSACGVQDLSRSDFVYGCLSQTGCQNIYKWAIYVNCSAKGTPNQQVNTTLPLIGEGTDRFRV